MSTDEKTGIRSNERAHPTRPMLPGLVERRAFDYIRHGTQTLIANFEVATGKVIASSIGPTRTEVDLVVHVEHTIEISPTAEWIFIVDQLNTHQSESLVRLVVERCGIEAELGMKDNVGI